MQVVPKFLKQFLYWLRSFTEKDPTSKAVSSPDFAFQVWDDEPQIRQSDLLQDEHGN